MKDFNEFQRKMRCQYLFDDGSTYSKHPFYINTGYEPQYSSEALDNYIFATKYELSKIKIQKVLPNLTPTEKTTFTKLKKNNDEIRKADKKSTLCVLSKNNYISEGLGQLQNEVYYAEIIHTETET